MASNSGVGFFTIVGSILAATLSWVKWHSLGWAIIHGLLCGWFYVLYFWLRFGFSSVEALWK